MSGHQIFSRCQKNKPQNKPLSIQVDKPNFFATFFVEKFRGGSGPKARFFNKRRVKLYS